MSNEVGVAFIGSGTVAEMHGRAVTAVPEARLVGAYDLDAEKAKLIASRFGGRVYESVDQLLADRSVDAVHVLTPVSHHLPHAIASLQAGKHVLIEKPVAQTQEDIAVLKAAAAEAGRVCMPAHNYIYAPSVRRAKRLMDAGKLGKIASLWILYNIFHSEQAVATYGGVLRAVCTHHAYSLLYLLGRPRRVTAVVSRVRDTQTGAEEQAMIVCEMENGAIANLWSSFAADDPTNDPWTVVYKILGTNGGASYSWNEAQFTDDGGPAWGMPCYEESFMEEIGHFINRCVLAGESPLSTLDDAADALSILTAAERSISNPDALAKVVYER
ncbi:MAG: Gfo/Idh/MocA family protein [Terriglobia bacterium]